MPRASAVLADVFRVSTSCQLPAVRTPYFTVKLVTALPDAGVFTASALAL